jgi:ribosomal protein L11 methyltransferase
MWIELAVEVPTAAAEVIADAVGSLTGGVEIRDADTILRVGGGRSVIVAQVAPDAEEDVREELEAACARLRDAGVSPDPVSVRRREAHEDEWRDVWKRYFRAQRVGRSFLIRPSWELVTPGPGDRVLDIDPGRAFGTGGHASTRLVIAVAEEISETRAAPVARFLDLGCGSGILSIAAARLWPTARGLALDVDPEAVATTRENLALNQVTSVEARVGSLADVSEPADVLLANIEAAVLVPLAPAFPARLAPGGALVLSGLLAGDVAAVSRAYAALGFVIEARRDEDEWAALRLALRPAPAP